MSNREIADVMFLAEKTVKNYVSNLLAKLGFQRRTEAALFAQRQFDRTHPQTTTTRRRVKTSGPSSVTAIVCSKCAESWPSLGHDAPPVVEHVGLVGADVDHGFDGEDHALFERRSRRAGPVVGHLGALVHRGADRVAHVLAHHGEARRLGDALDRATDLVQAVADAQLVDARPQGALGHVDERCAAALIVTHARGVGRVAVVALDDRAAVDRDDVALFQRGSRRGCRGRSCRWDSCRSPRETVVVEEVRARPALGEHVGGDLVQLASW